MRLGICLRNIDETLRAFRIDTGDDDAGEMAFTNNLNEMRRLTGASAVSILPAKVAGTNVWVICRSDAKDDNDTTDDLKPSALDREGDIVLRGSIVVVGAETDGDDDLLRSLTDDELDRVKDRLALVDIGRGTSKYNTYVLCDVEMEE